MADSQVFADVDSIAHAAAEQTVGVLRSAINRRSEAVWVLAGGTSPRAAYYELANRYSEALDWQRDICS